MRTIKVSRRRRARYGSFATSRRVDGRTSGSSVSSDLPRSGFFRCASLAASVLAFPFRFGIKTSRRTTDLPPKRTIQSTKTASIPRGGWSSDG